MLTDSDRIAHRVGLLRQQGGVVWLTGLPGSGKTTLSNALEEQLLRNKHLVYVLDGDVFRTGLSSDLRFSPEDRQENIRRAGEVAALMADAGLITVVAFVSPYRADRLKARKAVRSGRFVEVFVDAPLSVCEQRDPKGMYKKARAGLITNFTGIGAPYEPPEKPDLVLKTTELSIAECAQQLLELLRQHNILTT